MTSTPSLTRSVAHAPVPAPTWGRVVRHYAEMLVAMFAGMAVLGGLRGAAGLTVEFADSPGLSYVLMATDMAIGMAAWMRYRGHGWPGTLEMSGSMYVPTLLLPLVWTDVMSPMAFMIASHVVMSVAMLVVLLRRRHELVHC